MTGAVGGVVAAGVRAEDVPEPLVPALPEQVQVEFAERRQEAVAVGGTTVYPPG